MKATNHTRAAGARRAGRKKVRRRIHRGRLAILLTIFVVVILLIMTALSRCSSSAGTEFRSVGQHRAPSPEAVAAAKADAAKVLDTAPGSMERQEALLFIHARHSRLEQAGYRHAADDYISTAADFLHSKGVIDINP